MTAMDAQLITKVDKRRGTKCWAVLYTATQYAEKGTVRVTKWTTYREEAERWLGIIKKHGSCISASSYPALDANGISLVGELPP
jgi:hypothetical protein